MLNMSKLNLAVFTAIAIFNNSTTFALDDYSREDATLNDIFFLDAHTGWSVGDQGVIWHTPDGGMTWQLQPSGTVCSLRSVFFVDRRTGWAVGGQGLPYTAGGRGLVLHTTDGGTTWQPLSWNQFPRLVRVQFLNSKTGWVWGESSEYYRSGLYGSDSGGRMWAPASGSAGGGWLGGCFFNPDSGVLAGSGGATALVVNRTLTEANPGHLGNRSIRSVKPSNDGSVWAVADGGLILRSGSRGASWSVLSSGMPDEAGAIFDWRGLHAIARSVWVVGRPGTVLLHSADAGTRWQAIPTGQFPPLEAVWFHDQQRGWAAGSLGTILATQDGGRSWQVQRRGGERAAVLSIHGTARSTPLLAHVLFGAERGFLTADLSVVCHKTETEQGKLIASALRAEDAIRVAGGVRSETEWRFPAVPAATSIAHVLAGWDRQNEGQAIRELERRIVIALRTWRPDVVLTDSPNPKSADDPANALVSQVVERAFLSAADPSAFPELVDSARLIPWKVSKLYAATIDHLPNADVVIDSSEISRQPDWAGKPLDDQATLAMSLLSDTYEATSNAIYLHKLASRLPAGSGNEVMSGIVLEPGGPARRRLPTPVEITEAQKRAVQARRNLLSLINRAQTQQVLAQQMNAQVGGLLRDLPPDQAGNLLYNLARTHFTHGRWGDTRDLLEKMLADNPNHLVASEAQRWLIQFYASGEARHREQVASIAGQRELNPKVPPQTPPNNENRNGTEFVTDGPTTARMSFNQKAGAVGGVGSGVPWAQGAIDRSKHLMQEAPLVWSEPQVQFAVAAAQRALGNVKDADKFYTTFSFGRDNGAWSDAARSERWIRDRQGMPAKPVVIAQRASSPPRLDGILDDGTWKATPAITFSSQNQPQQGGGDTQVRISHDQQFLYIALACSSADGESVEAHRPRMRDMDLAMRDHVDLYLDIDRDYCTYYHLAVDDRGCVFEDCWGDRTWKPTWYVASNADEHGYRIEAAIPLGELTDSPPVDGTVWAFNAVRVIPGQAAFSWSRPAGISPRPDGMGLLLFSDGPAAVPPRPAVAN
jgi:photosystem II stability/assembly factor-like uncharacterized protein